ncbi:hypothetical protein KRP22_012973 [Phytophthora ramorum]|nr:hypothetical protein KRP22_8595 [Phytophthora ramorum]
MVLTLVNLARSNGYTGVSTNLYWSSRQVYNPKYQTFANEVYPTRISIPSLPTSHSVVEGTDHTSRDLRRSAVVNDGLDEIAYPITTIDTCDCVTFPSGGFARTECGTDVYWGTFQVKFTDGTCYDVAFDEADVYAQCPSGRSQSTEMYTEYVWCEVDFTEGTDTPEDLPMIDATTNAKKVVSSGETKTTTLRQETTAVAKNQGHSHIHLTVHRVLTLVLEAKQLSSLFTNPF